MRRSIFVSCLVLASLASAAEATASAEVESNDKNLYVEGMFVATYQRTGLFADVRARYRQALYTHDHEALHSNFWGVGLIEQASPVFSETGVYAEVQPASFFRLTAAYQLVGYFGTFNTMRTTSGCDGAASLGSADTRCAFPMSGVTAAGRADYGHRAWVEALSQAQLGRFHLSDSFTAERWWFREDWAAGASATHWINEQLALPQRKQDTVLTNTAMVMFDVLPDRGGSNPHLMVGAMSSLSWAAGTGYLNHRVGPVGILHVPEWHGLRDLSAVLMVQFYTHDRYAKGPVPFVGLALSISTPNFVPQALR